MKTELAFNSCIIKCCNKKYLSIFIINALLCQDALWDAITSYIPNVPSFLGSGSTVFSARNPCMSAPVQYKPVLFQGRLYLGQGSKVHLEKPTLLCPVNISRVIMLFFPAKLFHILALCSSRWNVCHFCILKEYPFFFLLCP